MTRWIQAANAAETAKNQICLLAFVELALPSGTLYLHTGYGTITSGGHDYLGMGSIGSIDPIREEADPFPRTVKMTLSGIDSTLVTAAMSEQMFNRSVTLKRGFLDITAGTLVAPIETLWHGLVNRCQIKIEEGGATSIEVECESRLRKGAPVAYYTKEDLQLAHPSDTFFNFLADIPGFTGNWGSHAVGPPVTYPPDFNYPDFYWPG